MKNVDISGVWKVYVFEGLQKGSEAPTWEWRLFRVWCFACLVDPLQLDTVSLMRGKITSNRPSVLLHTSVCWHLWSKRSCTIYYIYTCKIQWWLWNWDQITEFLYNQLNFSQWCFKRKNPTSGKDVVHDDWFFVSCSRSIVAFSKYINRDRCWRIYAKHWSIWDTWETKDTANSWGHHWSGISKYC